MDRGGYEKGMEGDLSLITRSHSTTCTHLVLLEDMQVAVVLIGWWKKTNAAAFLENIMNIRYFLIPIVISLFCVCQAFAATYQPWSENVFAQLNKEYGPQAEKRMRYLLDIILKNQGKTVQEKLRIANDTMNHLPWIADKIHWDKADYWATPMETIATFGGDCEDIAIAKFIMLRHLGIPATHLRLNYVKIKKTGENHMVLAYVDRIDLPRAQRGAGVWILDNVDQKVKKLSERTDLMEIYATDAEGNVVVFKDTDGKRSILGVREHAKMKKLDEIKQKIAENNVRYKELNNGRPLHPH